MKQIWFWHVVHLLIHEPCRISSQHYRMRGVFAAGAISDLRGFPDMDNFKNHPLEWTKHFSSKKKMGRKKKKKKLPCISEFGPKSKIWYCEDPDIYTRGKGWRKTKQKTGKNKSNMVLMLFREYEFRLRTASSCLLLKYINSVFVFHLQLQQHHQQSELHTSFFVPQ